MYKVKKDAPPHQLSYLGSLRTLESFSQEELATIEKDSPSVFATYFEKVKEPKKGEEA